MKVTSDKIVLPLCFTQQLRRPNDVFQRISKLLIAVLLSSGCREGQYSGPKSDTVPDGCDKAKYWEHQERLKDYQSFMAKIRKFNEIPPVAIGEFIAAGEILGISLESKSNGYQGRSGFHFRDGRSTMIHAYTDAFDRCFQGEFYYTSYFDDSEYLRIEEAIKTTKRMEGELPACPKNKFLHLSGEIRVYFRNSTFARYVPMRAESCKLESEDNSAVIESSFFDAEAEARSEAKNNFSPLYE